jgi:hypothetical protein
MRYKEKDIFPRKTGIFEDSISCTPFEFTSVNNTMNAPVIEINVEISRIPAP